MEEFSKSGRKLRPRKSSGASHGEARPAYSSSDRSFGRRDGDSRSSFGGERRSFNGERRSFGEHRDGERRSSFGGERRSSFSGERRSFNDERRSFGEHRDGERRSSFGGERRSFNGERRSFGEHRDGERRSSFGGERHSSFGGERRSFNGERRSFGEHRDGDRRSFGNRPQRGGSFDRKPFGKRNEPMFSKASEEGINRMISRRPQVSESRGETSRDYTPVMSNEVRLNKFIANSGVCSRREADTLIQAGVVTVNGEVITELGTKVNVITDDVRFNGERLKGEEKVYIIMNKPKGYVTTTSDPHAEQTVLDLLKGCEARVFPVGRLDKATTGVLMFTNDGEIAERLTHPSYEKKKIYQVILDKELTQEDHDQILSGVVLTDGEVKADELEYIESDDKRKLGIEIHSGKNRIVRRIFESLGYDVKALDRVYFAGLTKKGLKKGEWRFLTEGEVNILKMGAYV